MGKVMSDITLSLINISGISGMGGEERKDYFANYCVLKASMESDIGVTYPYATENIL